MLNLCKKNLIKLLVLSLIAFILFFFYFKFEVASYPYHADENDYVESINQGFLANYLDLNAPNAWVYIADAYQSFQRGEDIDTFQKYHDTIHNQRHYHGAVGFYPFVITREIFPALDLRLVPIFIILTFSIYWLFNKYEQSLSQKISFLIFLVFILSYGQLNFLISPHLIYLFITLIFLRFISSCNQSSKLFLPILFLTLAFCSIEFALILPIVWILTTWATSSELREFRLKRYLKSLLHILKLSCLVLLVFWPAGIIKLAMPLSYIVYSALAMQSDWYQFYHTLLFKDWLLTLLAILCLVSSIIYILIWKKLNLNKACLGFAWYVVLMFFLNLLNNFVYKIYLIQTIIPGLLIIQVLSSEMSLRCRKIKLMNYIFVTSLILILIICAARSTLGYQIEMRKSANFLQMLKTNFSNNRLIVIGYTPNISNVNLPGIKINYHPELKNDDLICNRDKIEDADIFIFLMRLSQVKEKVSCFEQFTEVKEVGNNVVIILKS